jgi:hypothetical protein
MMNENLNNDTNCSSSTLTNRYSWNDTTTGSSLYDSELCLAGKPMYGIVIYDEAVKVFRINQNVPNDLGSKIAEVEFKPFKGNSLKEKCVDAVRFAKRICELHVIEFS